MELNWSPNSWLSEQYSTPLYVLGLFGSSSLEWFFTIIACLRTPIVTAGLYEKFEEFLTWAQVLKLKHLLISSDKLETIFTACILKELVLQSIIVLGKFDESLKESFSKLGTQLIQIEELFLGDGKSLTDLNDEHHPCFLSLTSGTTEPSRFCVVTQLNVISTLASVFHLARDVSTEDSFLSYMNFSLLGNVIFMFLISISGGNIGIAFDPLNFTQDAKIMKPTFLIMVPQVLEYLYNGIKDKVAQLNGVYKSMYNKAFASKLKKYEKTGELKHKLWDSMVFKKMKNILGGNLKVIVLATALSNKDMVRYLRIVMGCEVLEGYGMMECTVASCCCYPGDPSTGTFGGPLLGYEAKLHYTGMLFDDQTHYYGELMIKGPGLVQRYYGKTEPLISPTGWYSTGDLVSIIPETGGLKFIDRINFIYKSRSGRWICTQKLEILYKECKLVSQFLCMGDRRVEGVFAIIVPNQEFISRKWKPANYVEYCLNSDFKKALMREFLVVERIHKLQEHERIIDVFVETEKWVGDDVLTQTLKLRRYVLIERYSEVFEKMKVRYLENSYN